MTSANGQRRPRHEARPLQPSIFGHNLTERTMNTQATPAGGPAIQTREVDPARLLEEILARTEKSKRVVLIDGALQQRIDKLEELLPPYLKGHGARLAKRAVLTMAWNAKLQECTPDSFVRCVLEAAEMGLAIDGRLAHAVPFNNKVRSTDGVERYRMECQFIPDYKGLIAVARRSGIIRDIHGDVVCANDHFEAHREGGRDVLIHKRDLKRPRGEVYAAYAIVLRPDGSWRYELMDLDELHAVRARSKSYTRAGEASGPWKTDPKEMYRKTVIRRTLKAYAEDAALKRALDKDDDIDAELDGPPAAAFTATTWPAPPPADPRSQQGGSETTLPEYPGQREPGDGEASEDPRTPRSPASATLDQRRAIDRLRVRLKMDTAELLGLIAEQGFKSPAAMTAEAAEQLLVQLEGLVVDQEIKDSKPQEREPGEEG
jgi:recombination protein RecT